ncbi:electron transfer flavoprotein subunit alpha/FixB family protein [Vallitalea pronyensis]|uniref:Electron transfer flavoprotein subunit alpha/FixB family protein n=1 Tax=Vallitalea pronyensis TaxID=1348613 RepID=A0A8J8MHS9_9FIRM|nr:electron transfer flavoprotein subunit alpha/FixB family protein [Vallitalea pronyensis]QUI21900.1 electron transfer flavoprotein subunit alpha/FixB family protein [Vallitalea pronyensis]
MGNKKLWIISDQHEAYATEHVLQILHKALKLKKSQEDEVSVVCVGLNREEQFKTLFQYGANRIIFCEQKSEYSISFFVECIASLLKDKQPDVILFPASITGKQTAAILSVRYRAGLTACCTDIQYDHDMDRYVFIRPAMSESVLAEITCINDKLQMCTIKENIFDSAFVTNEICWNIADYTYEEKEAMRKVQVLERKALNLKERVDIKSAKIVFVVGRGMKHCMDLCQTVAQKYGAVIVGTKAAVEEKMIHENRQIGQSGISISPDICLSFGVSGASQHVVGIKGARLIIAVNPDKNAPIFEYADYVIVDKGEHILQELAL